MPVLAAVMDAFTMPTVRKHKPLFWFFLMAFHVAIAVLIVAHLDLIPQLRITPADSPHMIGNGAVGVGAHRFNRLLPVAALPHAGA